MSLEHYFSFFRKNIIGINKEIPLITGEIKPILYADWIASGRQYGPIEDFLKNEIAPLVANTHTETTYTGTAMTRAYHDARLTIKNHVGATKEDSLFLTGFGMTAAVNKLQRILGIRRPEGCGGACDDEKKPLVIVTHMEHHSNQISWEECYADVEIIPREENTGLPDLRYLKQILDRNKDRPLLLGSFSACSNVTGIMTPYYEMARLMHQAGGYCFIDFAASAPYVDIEMHPEDPEMRLDAVMFSPHKFLGGPGSSGVLVLNNELYNNKIPDNPGGGTVKWTTPFGSHAYFDEIEVREDGGTPGFLQAIRTALAIKLKEAMNPEKIQAREEELKEIMMNVWKDDQKLFLLESRNVNRLGVFSFYAPGEHHNLIVRLLNDRYGIQTRGGCSCAGTYGHILFSINHDTSRKITDMIDHGDLTQKPGWVRVSLHPTMTDEEAKILAESILEVIHHYEEWADDYTFHKDTGEFIHKTNTLTPPSLMSTFEALPKTP